MIGVAVLTSILGTLVIIHHFTVIVAVSNGVVAHKMEEDNLIVNLQFLTNPQYPSSNLIFQKDKRSGNSIYTLHDPSPLPTPKYPHFVSKTNDTAHAAGIIKSSGGTSGHKDVTSSTRDTIVVLIALTIIFFTLIATYFLWRKRRSSFSVSQCNRLEEYRYSRLSQNDVEVDTISFQGDLTHKTLVNAVPVCAEEESEDRDEQVRPATLCLEHDSLVTISNGENAQRKGTGQNTTSISAEDSPVNLLLEELSDEDLLQ